MSLAPLLASALLSGATDEPARIGVPGGVIEVTIGPAEPSVPRFALVTWVETSARAVAGYFGRFPVPHVRLSIITGGRGAIGNGRTWGEASPHIRIAAGRQTTDAALSDDWVLTHEMTHLALPDLPDEFSWMEEGLATYVEPVARARAGGLSAAEAWGEMIDGMPKGLPGPRDRGLDGTRAWGRTYWGGALFWLLADVEIRQRTKNKQGLEDALRGILDAGGSIRENWPAERVLATGDKALHLTVLGDLHDRFGSRAEKIDLDALWRRLGVVKTTDGVRFDDNAPLAALRSAITGARGSGARGRSLVEAVPSPNVGGTGWGGRRTMGGRQ